MASPLCALRESACSNHHHPRLSAVYPTLANNRFARTDFWGVANRKDRRRLLATAQSSQREVTRSIPLFLTPLRRCALARNNPLSPPPSPPRLSAVYPTLANNRFARTDFWGVANRKDRRRLLATAQSSQREVTRSIPLFLTPLRRCALARNNLLSPPPLRLKTKKAGKSRPD
ncbi:hypothetical protein VN12_19270 [Pirellula sp. SH-Sr6A]|nr:hypothetical protein VN12_19270 [Pirellula sp. SH-Sr6A]